MFKNKKYARTIISIPDDLWNENKNILPDEKSESIIGRPIVLYRKVIDGKMFVLRIVYKWKMLPKVIVLVIHVIKDSKMGTIKYFRYIMEHLIMTKWKNNISIQTSNEWKKYYKWLIN